MTTEKESFYIVVLNYNNWPDTIECLESLFKSSDQDFHLIVVDNHSTDDSPAFIRRWAEGMLDVRVPSGHPLKGLSFPPVEKPLRVHELEYDAGSDSFSGNSEDLFSDVQMFSLVSVNRNLGFAGGINSALNLLRKCGKNGFVWFLNPDTVVDAGTISAIKRRTAGREEEKIIWGCVSYYYDNPGQILFYGGAHIQRWVHGMRQLKGPDSMHDLDYIAGSFLLLHTCVVEDLGMFPEEYFLYWEEADYCTKARRRGYQLRVIDDARVYDKISGSIGTGFAREFYYTLSGLKFYRKYFPLRFPVIFLTVCLKVGKKFLLRDFVGVRAVIRAVMAFLGGSPGRLFQ
ncbi:MAG: glycosyltransferase family 2 protein [Acidobacteria bacterium]|nr:glycosyltransferase family 2 protein [Acidobacteriota bacterium]